MIFDGVRAPGNRAWDPTLQRTKQEATSLFVNILSPIHKKLRRGVTRIAPLAVMAAALYGCGGGGTAAGTTGGTTGGGTTGGGTDTFALSGIVSLPGAGAAASRDSSGYVGVENANVKIYKVEDGTEVATDTTDSTGKYEFNGVETGVDYKVEATKDIDGKTYTIRAIVTIDDSAVPETRDLDPLTTVSADAALDQYQASKVADPNTKPHKLEDICKEIEDKERANFVAPDLSDAAAVNEKKDGALASVSPDGNYLGKFEGDGEGVLAAQIKDGKFWIIGIGKNDIATIESVIKNDNGSDPGNGDPGTGDPGTGDPGTDPGDSGNHDGDGPQSPFAIGTVDSFGVISAATNDGSLTVTGIVIGNKGVGTWADDLGNSGKWVMRRKEFAYAGVYIGTVADESAADGGHFAVMVTEDKRVLMHSYSVSYDTHFVGVGTVNDDGTYAIRWRDNWGDTGTVTGTISNDGLNGTVTVGEELLNWTASRLFDPKDAFFE